MSWQIGLDIGGTFTDCVCLGENGVFWAKSPTTPGNPERGVLDGVEALAIKAGTSRENLLRDTEMFVHGCTIGTNAVIERTGARVALLTTRGQEDVIRIGRVFQKRAGLSESEILHTSRLRRPRPLLEHRLTFGIHERLDRNGQVVAPLNEAQIQDVACEIKRAGVDSLAVCYLWSFLNPAHEQRTKEILRSALPDLDITLSSELAPVIGEYERAVASVLNAYVGPSLRRYLEPLEAELHQLGYTNRLHVFYSGGGMMSVEAGLAEGVRTIDSGPVGGVVAAYQLAKSIDQPNIICGDMGGTSFDVSVIWNGHIEEDQSPTIDQYTFRIPRVAIKSIGAGGGSIAWIDGAGILRVGPRSAGSLPGPACYGRGGTLPTVTDADVILGLLNGNALLGGQMPIDEGAAHRAFEPLANYLQTDVETIAAAVVNLINAQMADLVRRATLERGYDPRDFTLVMYGGAGPVHGVAIAEDIGCRSVCFPDLASTFAAKGMASCDALYAGELSRTMRSPFTSTMARQAHRTLDELTEQVRTQVTADGHDPADVIIRQQVFMKYQNQASELPVDVESTGENGFGSLVESFRRLYQRTYGVGAVADFAGIEISTFRVEGRLLRNTAQARTGSETAVDIEPVGSRRVMLGQGGWIDAPVARILGSMAPAAGQEIRGPFVLERYGDTIIIPPGYRGCVQVDGSLLLEVAGHE